MKDSPLAFFVTWTCYGTWVPGDDRGWTKWHNGDQHPKPFLAEWCREQMVESSVLLDAEQRETVNDVVREHCKKRKWRLHGVNCRTNHCHVVVSAPGYSGDQVRDQLKSWSTRLLKDRQQAQGVADLREHWWSRRGSVRCLFDDESLDAAIRYCLEAQDIGGSKANE